MANKTILSVDLEKEVMKLLNDYGDVITDALAEIVPEVAEETAKELKATSPKKTGKYAAAWTSKVEKKRLYVTATVYNDGHAQLTHLLEHGHPMPHGGRARAIPHIEPAEQKAIQSMEDKVAKAIEEAMSK